MQVRLITAAAAVAITIAPVAQAASTDVVFRGGATIGSGLNCPDWNPAKSFFVGTYWRPVAGSTNGPDTVITFHDGTSEGFELRNGAFTSAYKVVNGYHIFTRVGTYKAQIKITSQSPATITTATQNVLLKGSVKGWGFQANCEVTFSMSLTRDLNP